MEWYPRRQERRLLRILETTVCLKTGSGHMRALAWEKICQRNFPHLTQSIPHPSPVCFESSFLLLSQSYQPWLRGQGSSCTRSLHGVPCFLACVWVMAEMKASDKKYHHELPHPTPPRDISLAFTPLHDIYNCKMKRLNWGGVKVDKQDYFFLLFTKSGKSTYAVIDYTDTFWGKKSGRTYRSKIITCWP